ncbi:MAG: hypothetical protein HC837_09905 [Chloroflexaceae bacterium]|nr:hypothetical protein [Chloroflexaceae bacterium]
MNLAKHWRQKGTYYLFQGQRHKTTGEIRFPARPPMLGERADDWLPTVLSGKGEIYSFTVLRQAATEFESATPFALALIRLAEGPMITAQLTDCAEEDLFIGQPVEMVTRLLRRPTDKDGVLVYGYKFRPVLSSPS